MFSKHTRIVKHLPVLPVLWPLPVRREGQFAPGVFPSGQFAPGVFPSTSLPKGTLLLCKVKCPWAGTWNWEKTLGDFFPGNLNEAVADPQPLRADGEPDWIMTVQWRYRCCAT